jgi:hypothetical protein
MKAWSNWFNDLLPQLPGCPDPQIEHELLRACQDFFTRSRAWQVIQAPVAIAADQTSLAIAPADAEQELVRIEGAWLDGMRLNIFGVGDMDSAFPDDWQTHTGAISTLVQITPGTVLLYPIPVSASATGLKLRMSVKPSDTATGIPDDQYVKYRDPLASGARSRLMLQAEKKWSNPGLGALNASVFDAAINSASIAAARSFSTGRISARPKFA